MDKATYRIAQFGTYDIESLGDTTFPKVLAHGLAKQARCEIELFSMTECANPYNQNSHVYSFEQFAQRQETAPFDAVVLGGGEFLHFHKMDVIIDGKQVAYPEGYIWKRPLELAAQYRIPAFVNLVGVPYDMTAEQQKELCDYLQNVRYVSVRDVFSAKRLQAAGVKNAHCIADNLWYMNEMYPKAQLDVMRGELEQRTGKDLSSPYIVVQYGTTRKARVLAEQLKRVKAETGYRICLMSVNYCHEDREGMRLLAAAGDGAFEVIDDYLQPPEMMAVISGAKAFLGTSLHGNLTAASYGVPFVGIDMYSSFVSKMDGIFTMIGCEEYLVPDESAIKSALSARLSDTDRSVAVLNKVGECQVCLDRHFEQIANILKGEAS